mmetsp:Transcript_14584/g.62514  ORF Transcript_14584/g.62514 Transcript_14584/m.62514 type:complete len:325 (-) Transcript_14584:21-995(-)
MRRLRLDALHVPLLEEQVDDGVAPVLVVEEHEQRPVHQPRARTRLRQRVGVRAVLHRVLEAGHVLHGGVPVLPQDVRREFAPQRRRALLRVRAQAPVVVQELRRRAVVPALELELGVREKALDVLRPDAVLVAKKREVVGFVAAQLLHERRVGEERHHLRRLLLQLLQVRDHLLAALRHLRGRLLRAVQALVDVGGEVDHVRLAQQLDLRLEDLPLGVHLAHLQELEEREHQVAVQVLTQLRGQVVPRRVGRRHRRGSCEAIGSAIGRRLVATRASFRNPAAAAEGVRCVFETRRACRRSRAASRGRFDLSRARQSTCVRDRRS